MEIRNRCEYFDRIFDDSRLNPSNIIQKILKIIEGDKQRKSTIFIYQFTTYRFRKFNFRQNY